MEEELNDLAVNFFRKFSRMEYALKVNSFHYGDGDAKANWSAFAASISDCFNEPREQSLADAFAFLERNPPKKQVIRNDILDWDDAVPQSHSNVDLMLLYVRRVRNNLFHGGKFNGQWFEPQRSFDLVTHSLVILDACIEASAGVKAAFEG